MSLSPEAREVVLAFADDEHMIGQRHTEWIGVAPFLEEDLAMSSIAQDELGHAAALYQLLVDASDPASDTDSAAASATDAVQSEVDRLAFRREPHEYRCCALVEHPNGDWAFSLVRHWLYDQAELYRWEAVTDSCHGALAAIATRALREEVYHRRHAHAMLTRLAEDPEARPRIAGALDEVLPLAVAIFEPTTGEPAAHSEAVITASSSDLRANWWHDVSQTLTELGLERPMPSPEPILPQGRRTRSEHFAQLHSQINEVLDIAPQAPW